jgi:hypothetical protein
VVADSTKILLRRRLSLGLVEVQTGQVHPIIGIPELVPVPRKVIFNERLTRQI